MSEIRSPIQLGAFVRRARTERGLSQIEFSTQLGVPRTWLSRFERGTTNANIERVFRVLQALGHVITIAPEPAPQTDEQRRAWLLGDEPEVDTRMSPSLFRGDGDGT